MKHRCGLITLGNEIQLGVFDCSRCSRCGLITLGNEIQLDRNGLLVGLSCGLITLGNEIQQPVHEQRARIVVD